jgi:predicted HTH transcriptional regulator
MFAALRQAGLPEPDFDDRISSFRVTFLNSPTRRSDNENVRRRRDRRDEILAVLASRGELSRAQISDELGLTDAGTRKWLTTLRDEGKVEITTEQTRSKNARYRVIGSGTLRTSRPGKLK